MYHYNHVLRFYFWHVGGQITLCINMQLLVYPLFSNAYFCFSELPVLLKENYADSLLTMIRDALIVLFRVQSAWQVVACQTIGRASCRERV